MTYDNLLIEADKERITVKEKPLVDSDGRIFGKRIAIRRNVSTSIEKTCVLAEELGHYHTGAGDITDQSKPENRKQERQARLWAYNRLVGLQGLVSAYKHGCTSAHETAEFLSVTEEFLLEAIKCYRGKYGVCAAVDNYVVYFEPCIGVLEMI